MRFWEQSPIMAPKDCIGLCMTTVLGPPNSSVVSTICPTIYPEAYDSGCISLKNVNYSTMFLSHSACPGNTLCNINYVHIGDITRFRDMNFLVPFYGTMSSHLYLHILYSLLRSFSCSALSGFHTQTNIRPLGSLPYIARLSVLYAPLG